MVELVFTYWGFLNSRSKDFDKSCQNAGRATSVVVALKGMYWWWRWWWPVAVKQLRGHQWSMRTCPPWEAVSHFCCFILLLPLQDTENKETFVLQFAFFDGGAPSPTAIPPSRPSEPTAPNQWSAQRALPATHLPEATSEPSAGWAAGTPCLDSSPPIFPSASYVTEDH